TETPTLEPMTELPTVVIPMTEVLTTERPIVVIPTTEAPTLELTTELPTVVIPSTETPIVERPMTERLTTERPSSETIIDRPTTERPVVIVPSTVELSSIPQSSTELPSVLPPVDHNNVETEGRDSSIIDVDFPDVNPVDINVTYQPTGTLVPDDERIVPDGDVTRSVVFEEHYEALSEILRNPYLPLIEEESNNDDERNDVLDILIGLKPLKLPENSTIVYRDNNVKHKDNNQKIKHDDKENIEVAKANNDKSVDKHPLDLDVKDFLVATVKGPVDVPDPALPTFISGLGGFSF
ncbi:hypothetical protein, partial [Macrococcus sp. PK]|uniref:hypothetical protein n=1 Tax=Macrococcus sp. PK TaxID=2801919 RepID=UPI001F0EFF76|nr:hypothetical protein [Macrococcus sp. PK]